MSVFIWTLCVSSEKPFVCFDNPVTKREESIQIVNARSMMSGKCWKFYSNDRETCSFTFILTDKVRYKLWPDDIVSIGMIHAFLADNKVLIVK